MNSASSDLHFYILSKGFNAGKPVERPASNCFVITAIDEEEKKKLYWVCYSLWISGSYIPYLKGEAIPALHISDASALIEKVYRGINFNLDNTKALIAQLSQIVHAEKQLSLQQKLTAELKNSLARRLTFHRPSAR